ncbi:alkaline-phosphatase-like protein [Daldinia bambusicola]|nr:alkaline-phosphatase-like protein [Daldinia bambusicola]
MISKRPTTGTLLLLVANILIPLGMLIFMTGLFRSRPLLDVAKFPSPSLGTTAHKAPFDKVIFMMVDALRTDFVFSKEGGFPFTQSLIRSGAAVPITALSAMPTLTLSRIKALTQGSSQSFLDAWLNVVNWPEDSRLDGGDTWLLRLKESRTDRKKLVFYGIEEWVDLYPGVFDRKKDFSSFHLPRLVDIDRNITRNLSNELERDDWTALILHYLGLDCIAHMGGARSAHMRPKQLEMDDVVRNIYTALTREPHMKDTLLVLLGDHGMTAQGNHGGRLPEELAAATVFISPKLENMSQPRRSSPLETAEDYLYYSTVNQIDTVPTLSGLLGFPIPSKNSGVFIPDMLPAFDDGTKGVKFLAENARQIHSALELSRKCPSTAKAFDDGKSSTRCQGDLSLTDDLWEAMLLAEKAWVNLPNNETREHLKVSIYEASRFAAVAQGLLLKSVDNVSASRLHIGIGCIAVAAVLTYLDLSSLRSLNFGSCSVFIATAVHSATMFVPSLVEEEHHYWYWASLLWLVFLSVSRTRRSGFVLAYLGLVTFHFMGQCVNKHGTKYSIAGRFDDLIFAHPVILWIPALLSHVSAFVLIAKNLRTALGRCVAVMVSFALCAAAFGFKLSLTYTSNPESLSFVPHYVRMLVATMPQDRLLQYFWTELLACLLFFVWQHRSSYSPSRSSVAMTRVIELVNLYLRLQSRPKNLSLFLIFEFQLQVLLMMGLSPTETATTVVLLGQSAFYSMGRNNTIASLDLLNGFNGLGESSIVGVVLQSFLSNWIGPVWWSLAGLRLLTSWAEGGRSPVISTLQNVRDNSDRPKATKSLLEGAAKLETAKAAAGTNALYIEYLAMQTLFSALGSLVLDLACIYIWGHEDLWNIYAPKFINEFLWVFFHQLMVNSISCSIIWFLVGN